MLVWSYSMRRKDSNVINRVLQFEEGQQCVLVWSYSMRRKDGNVINRVLQFEEGQQCVGVVILNEKER